MHSRKRRSCPCANACRLAGAVVRPVNIVRRPSHPPAPRPLTHPASAPIRALTTPLHAHSAPHSAWIHSAASCASAHAGGGRRERGAAPSPSFHAAPAPSSPRPSSCMLANASKPCVGMGGSGVCGSDGECRRFELDDEGKLLECGGKTSRVRHGTNVGSTRSTWRVVWASTGTGGCGAARTRARV